MGRIRREQQRSPSMAAEEPSRRALWLVTVVGLSLWFVATVFADALVPIIIAVAEWVEALIGFDISGPREG